jgi:hypothetical protein
MQLFLGGTTAGTSWRPEFIRQAVRAGVPEHMLFNPHLKRKPGQEGPVYGTEARLREKAVKNDPSNLLLFYICPGVPRRERTQGLPPERIVEMAERIGLFTIYEMTKLMYLCPERVACVVDLNLFAKNGSVRDRLGLICEEIKEDFTDEASDAYRQLCEMHPRNILPDGTLRCPLYENLAQVQDWAFPRLLKEV